MKQIKKTLIIFMAAVIVMVGILISITAKAAVLTTPKINYIGIEHSPLVVGDTEKFTVTSVKYDGLVQYRAFLFDGKVWSELTSGYTTAQDSKTPVVLPETPVLKLGNYKLSVWVKKAGTIGLNKSGYDSYYVAALNCVSKDDANRVHANGEADYTLTGAKLTFNSIKDIGGIKGPYLYRLHILNTNTGVWTTRVSQYATAPSYTFTKAGTYMVVVHANTVKSTTWKNYLAEDKTVANQKSTYGTYEAWKTIMVTVNDSAVVDSISDGTDITSRFTDKDFKSFVYSLIGKTSPSPILYSDVKNIKVLKLPIDYNYDIPWRGNISSLSGIQYFTALTDLSCASNRLTTLDVSNNTKLALLECGNNPLKALDLSKNTALTELNCNNNQLTTLDVSKNTALTKLYCYGNQLTTLDVSKNTALTSLGCGSNGLTTLYTNTALTSLDCDYNKLTTLDVSKSIALTELNCVNNQLTTLDVSKNTALTLLNCSTNQLITLDTNTALTSLDCRANQLTTLDVSKSIALTELLCNSNQLTTLDVSKNTALTKLWCGFNKLETLDVSKNTALTSLRCEYNQLETLDVSKNTALTYLDCRDNQLITLDTNTALTSLSCYNNLLTTLDVSNNTALTSLECRNNQLTTLDVSKITALDNLSCAHNQITSLFSIKDTWYTQGYRPQYTDSSHTETTDTLIITIKD
ncbi:leucine-rich repeat domain-containing protein [Clostridium estertheticum]|uniref:leucine-rich repeat domain-containing protein n=1 Tax=Clostridium estertheticum TaxID=238834 RepID=UPI0013E95F70|nr:leucine-rich repeat domain-containing protein [Clostridium estertheticum]MBZ9685713.1 leucine-rich repeat domain-containing protein [Clostridium estertheticum]